jgi:formylglycine-generating enzyme required for sulfatase activity
MDDTPSYFKKCGKDCPVEQVSWHDAQKLIKKLNGMEKTNKYRLPTEAEWEYACRAGTTKRFCFGDDEADLKEYAWYDKYSQAKTHPVGQLKPNAWGIYDMHGNAWEWCQDRYGEYSSEPDPDPKGPSFGEHRVVRGGSWTFNASSARVSGIRYKLTPDTRRSDTGFRVARDL